MINKEAQAEIDLYWLYCEAESQCGIRSNYNAMVSAALFGKSTAAYDPYHPGVLSAISRKRKLELAVSHLKPNMQLFLFAMFAPHKPLPEPITKIFKLDAPIALFTSLADSIAQLSTLCDKCESDATAKQTIELIKIECRARKSNALITFYNAMSRIK